MSLGGDVLSGPPRLITVDPCQTAELLQHALQKEGIASDVHSGYGLALVSVWVGLVVWTNGERFWWRTGWDSHHRRFVYAWHPATDSQRAAHRIALRYEDLRATRPLPEPMAGARGDPV